MRKVNFFDQSPKGGWLRNLSLKQGDLVEVQGHVYRFGTERQGLDLVLTPIEPPLESLRRK